MPSTAVARRSERRSISGCGPRAAGAVWRCTGCPRCTEVLMNSAILDVSLKNCHDAGDLTGIERFLSHAAGVKGVHLDRTRAILGILLKPAWAALAMSASTLTVTLN